MNRMNRMDRILGRTSGVAELVGGLVVLLRLGVGQCDAGAGESGPLLLHPPPLAVGFGAANALQGYLGPRRSRQVGAGAGRGRRRDGDGCFPPGGEAATSPPTAKPNIALEMLLTRTTRRAGNHCWISRLRAADRLPYVRTIARQHKRDRCARQQSAGCSSVLNHHSGRERTPNRRGRRIRPGYR